MSWWNSDPVADASPLEMAKTTANAWWQNDPVADEKPKIPEQDPRITELQKPGVAQRMLRGVPVLGGLLDEIGAAGDAAVNYVTGGASGENYDTSLARRREAIKQDDAAHPIRNTVESLTGGLALSAGLPVAQVFSRGIAAPGMMRTAADAALNAGAYSAAHGFAEGEGGLENRVQTAKDFGTTGLVTGGVIGGAANALARSRAPTPANSVVRDADELGFQVPQFMEGGQPSRTVAAKLAAMPFTGDDINTAVNAARGNTARAAEQLSHGIGGAGGPAAAGEAVRDAIGDWVGPASRAVQNRVYQPVTQAMGNVRGPLTHTTNEVQRLVNNQTAAANPNIGAAAIREVENAITQPNGLTFDGIRSLRTRIGSLLDDKLNPDSRVDEAALRSIYGALSRDLEGMVQTAGPRATQAWQRANAINRQLAERREAVAKVVGARGDASGESVVDRIVRLSGSTQSGDVRTLQQARRAAGAQAWRQVAGESILRLGRNSANEFSPDTFVTKLSALSPAGRQILFNSVGDPHIERQLNALFRVSQALQRYSRMGNPSGTGGVVALTGLLGGIASGAAGPTLMMALAGRAAGNLMSRPAAIRNAGNQAMRRAVSGPELQRAIAAGVANVVSHIEGD